MERSRVSSNLWLEFLCEKIWITSFIIVIFCVPLSMGWYSLISFYRICWILSGFRYFKSFRKYSAQFFSSISLNLWGRIICILISLRCCRIDPLIWWLNLNSLRCWIVKIKWLAISYTKNLTSWCNRLEKPILSFWFWQYIFWAITLRLPQSPTIFQFPISLLFKLISYSKSSFFFKKIIVFIFRFFIILDIVITLIKIFVDMLFRFSVS